MILAIFSQRWMFKRNLKQQTLIHQLNGQLFLIQIFDIQRFVENKNDGNILVQDLVNIVGRVEQTCPNLIFSQCDYLQNVAMHYYKRTIKFLLLINAGRFFFISLGWSNWTPTRNRCWTSRKTD